MIEMCANVSDDVSAEGRWMTPDPLGGDISNPQSLNRYAYALNNPETLVDPLGLTAIQYACGVDFCPGAVSFGGGGGGDLFDYVFPTGYNSEGDIGQTIDAGGLGFAGGMWGPGSGSSGGGGGGAPPPAPKPAQPRVPATPPQAPTIGPYKPPPPPAQQKVTAGCMAAALIQNFIGDDQRAGATTAVNVGAAIGLGLVKQVAPSALPGPGWMYVGVAALWDAGMVAKSYGDCRSGGPSLP